MTSIPAGNDALNRARAELASTGVLRAGINMGNFLLVSGRTADGGPDGVSPDMARAIAAGLGVPVALVPFETPGELGDAVDANVWDIALIGAEPQRAEKIAFTSAYAQIEATYLVPPGSPIAAMAEVDRPGVRISVAGRSAYGLWLDRNITRATLVRAANTEAAVSQFTADRLDVLAGLRPALIENAHELPGARVLDGHFATVQQAVGTAKANLEAARFLAAFVEEAKASGFVASLIAKHGVEGRLSVAPPA
ncbi:MAG: transporter substrate-binding domain-containing protein [Dehalococcoidia bacterium]